MRFCVILLVSCFSSCLNFHSDGVTVADARQNYLDHEAEMAELISYFQKICPDSKTVTFNLDGESGGLELWVQDTSEVCGPKRPHGGEFDLESETIQACLKELNWTSQTVDSLTEKLKNVNCYYISVSHAYPLKIGYHIDAVCALSYSFYDAPLEPVRIEELKKENGPRVLNDSSFVNCDCIL